MGSSSSVVSYAGVDTVKVAIALAFLILFTTISPCLAQDSSVDISASVTEPPITPVIVGGGLVDYEVLGDIVADMWIDFFKDIVSRGDILSTLVTIVNTEITYNDVLLKGEIMDVGETITYTQVAESLRIGYGTNQKQLDINVPDLKAGNYLFKVSMTEPNGDVTIASKVFTVKMGLLDIITDLRVISTLIILALVLYYYFTKEKICQTQS